MTDALIVFTTFGTEEEAARVVRTLAEERLIACGNLVPDVRSIYPWRGEIQDQREVMAILKTRKQDWPVLMSRLLELNSYEMPECVAVRIASGSPAYMAWLDEVLGG